MPRIKSEELLERVAKGDFNAIKLKGLQAGSFYMVLETADGPLIHESSKGSIKEYPKVDHALAWLKRKTSVKEVVIDIEIWRDDAKKTRIS